MRPLRALFIFLVVVFGGDALLAPWLYWLAQAFPTSFPHVATSLFHRFVDRSLLIVALVGLLPLLRALGTISWCEFGLVQPHGQWIWFCSTGKLIDGWCVLIVLIVTLGGFRCLPPKLSHEQFAIVQ